MKKNLMYDKSIWSVEVPTDCSFSWRKILQLRPIVESFIKNNMAGKLVSFMMNNGGKIVN